MDNTTIIALDANSERFWSDDAIIPRQSQPLSEALLNDETITFTGLDIGFILSDDQALKLTSNPRIVSRSLGDKWLQGHMAIGICHFHLMKVSG